MHPITTSIDAPPPRVRAATDADAEALGRLGALLIDIHHQFDPARFFAVSDGTAQGYADYLSSQLAQPNAIILVIEQDGAVAGYAFAGIEGTDWMALRGPAGVLYDLIVDPACRGGKLGSTLLAAMLDALNGRAVPRIILFAAQQNEAARRLFARHGFRPTMVEMTREPG